MQFGFSRVDDYLTFREALAALLSSQPDMNLIAEAANGRESDPAVPCASAGHHPDGLQMPGMNGLDAMVAIRQEFPDARIIILTTYASNVQNAMNGALGLTS